MIEAANIDGYFRQSNEIIKFLMFSIDSISIENSESVNLERIG